MNNVLLVSSMKPGTGNETTSHRIKHHLESVSSVRVILFESNDFEDSEQFLSKAKQYNSRIVIGVHLFRSGRLFIGDKPQNFDIVLVVGGTDVNEDVKDAKKMSVMEKVVSKCRHIVCFSDTLKFLFLERFKPFDKEKVSVIIPGVVVNPSKNPAFQFDYPYILLPLGIREVKDPCYLMEAVEKRAKEVLIICGPVLSNQCYENFCKKIEGLQFVKYIGNISSSDVHSLMLKCVCVVNCSLSEGLSNAILEALALNVVVIARKIPGNESVIKDGENGFLFESPEVFVEKLANVDKIDRSKLSKRNENDLSNERKMYLKIICDLIKKN